MSLLNTSDTAFLFIDIQEKLLRAVFNKDIVEKKVEILAKATNILNLTSLITEQYPQDLGQTIENVKNNLGKNSYYYEKIAFNALEDANLLTKLQALSIKNIIVTGIETHICVYQTVEALIEKGFNVTIIKDCCGSRCETEYLSALDLMSKNGVKIKTTEMVLFELLKTAKHPDFKAIQNLIK